MCDFHDVAAQVRASTQDSALGFLFNISREQESLSAIADAQNRPVVVSPGRVEVANRRRPKDIDGYLAETQNISPSNSFDRNSCGFHCLRAAHRFRIVSRRALDN